MPKELRYGSCDCRERMSASKLIEVFKRRETCPR